MKFGQLIEYNMRNIFLEKSYTKWGGKTILGRFSRISKVSIYLWINSLKFYTAAVCFYYMASWGLSKHIKTKLRITCFYIRGNNKEATKRDLELVPLSHFLHNFWRKMFLWSYSITWPKFTAWLFLLGNMRIVIVCQPYCDVIYFEINPIFLIMPLFLHDQEVKTKIYISWKRKEFLR